MFPRETLKRDLLTGIIDSSSTGEVGGEAGAEGGERRNVTAATGTYSGMSQLFSKTSIAKENKLKKRGEKTDKA